MNPKDFLTSLGLSQYEELFIANDIDETVLSQLTDNDLRELGITSLGHRKKIIATLGGQVAPVAVTPPPAFAPQPVTQPVAPVAPAPSQPVQQPVYVAPVAPAPEIPQQSAPPSQPQEAPQAGGPLFNGLWFSNRGHSFFIDESKYPEDEKEFAYVMALGDELEKFINDYPASLTWIRANPPEEVEDKAAWMDLLMMKLMGEGWSLLWRGEMTTSAGTRGEVLSELWQMRDTIRQQLQWPESHVINVQRLWMEGDQVKENPTMCIVPLSGI